MAQPAPDAGTEPPAEAEQPPPEVSPEELEAIERALRQDAQAASDQGATPPAPPPPGGASAPPGGFSLQSLNPDLSFVADVALAWFSAEEPLQRGAHDPAQNGFTLQQLELSVGKAVDPYFRFDANIVFSPDEVEIEEAYATTLALPNQLQLRLGQFLTRFGRLNATHPHSWAFVDQPFPLSRVFGGESNRGLGFEGSWLAPLPWFVELVGSATDARGEESARSFLGASEERLDSALDFQFTGAVKQFFPLSDDLSLLWGLSAASGPTPYGQRRRAELYGTDLFLKFRPISDPGNPTVVSLEAELFYRRRHLPGDLLQDLSGFVQTSWRFAPRWGVAGRYEYGAPAWAASGREVEDPLDPDWTTDRHRASANLTFWPTEFSRVRLQGGLDFAGWREATDYSLMISFEFAVGAHGAHTF